MIKPLLRVLPSLSGNAKLACNLTDIRKIQDNNDKEWEASVRGAMLQPIASQLWQSNLEAGVVSSSWEYDLPKLWQTYSDVFYDSCFKFDKSDMLRADETISQPVRARDFEYGVKRVSYQKSGKQFAFFAPLYIDNVNDLPSYFLITVRLYTINEEGKAVYAINKTLRVNIGNEVDSKRGYIGRYLQRYLSKLDDRVAFCTPLTNQATYYGIDLKHGGFVTVVDNMMDRIYHYQNTIQNFDATIVGAFKRNTIAMKQILPLSFYFSVQDILSDAERIRYRHSYVEFSGAYYDKNGKKLPTYDFSTDYMQYNEDVLRMDPMTGTMVWGPGYVKNIMDVGFPSLNDCRYVNYEYANKLAPWFCRWKMKHSDDDHPYILNNSWAFSKNQDSNYRYGQFPSTFSPLTALAKYEVGESSESHYDMMLPLGDIRVQTSGRWLYAYAMSDGTGEYGPYYQTIDKYRQIMEGYCTNWFSVVKEYSDSIFDDAIGWRNVEDGSVYFGGILYDLRNVYDRSPIPAQIDKFAVILEPVMHVLTDKEMEKLTFSRQTLYRHGMASISTPNAVANDSVLIMASEMSQPNFLWADDMFDDGSGRRINQDEIRTNEIFVKSEDGKGRYIDPDHATCLEVHIDGSYSYTRLPLDYYSLDRYYSGMDGEYISKVAEEELNASVNALDIETTYMIANLVMPKYGYLGSLVPDFGKMHTAYSWLPVTRAEAVAYDSIPSWAFDGSYSYTDETFMWGLVNQSCAIEVNDVSETAASKMQESDRAVTQSRLLSAGLHVDRSSADESTSNETTGQLKSTVKARPSSGRFIIGYVPIMTESEEDEYIDTDTEETIDLYTDFIAVIRPDDKDIRTIAVETLCGLWLDGYEICEQLPSGWSICDIIKGILPEGLTIYDVLPEDAPLYTHEELLTYIFSIDWIVDDSWSIYDILWPKQSSATPEQLSYILRTRLNNYLMVRHSSDPMHIIMNSYTSDVWVQEPYSYYSLIDDTMNDMDYGAQIYYRSQVLPASYFPYVDESFDSYLVLKDYCDEMYEGGSYEWNVMDIYDKALMTDWRLCRQDHPAAYWAGCLSAWKRGLARSIKDRIEVNQNISEWEYVPVMSNNNTQVAANIYKERTPWTSHFYGSQIPQSRMWSDNDVLWADPYNLSYVFAYEGYPAHYRDDGRITHVPENSVFKDMYVKLLNKTHLFYWYMELFKDEILSLDNMSVEEFMESGWYKYLFAAVDRWVFSTNENSRVMNAPLRRKVYIPLEKLLEFPEYYGDDGAPNPYRSFTEFYNHVDWDNELKLFTMPSFRDYDHGGLLCQRLVELVNRIANDGEEAYVAPEQQDVKFELCFKKEMIRVDEDLWKVSNMDVDDTSIYRDIYFYKIRDILEHDQIYSDEMKVKMVSNTSYLSSMLSKTSSYTYIEQVAEDEWKESVAYYDTPKVLTDDPSSYILHADSMLVPFFDSIFIEPAHDAKIYTHYSMHDITRAEVVSDEPNPETGEYERINANFRFNQLDRQMMMIVSDDEKERYMLTNVYDLYDECHAELVVVNDDLKLAYSGLSTYVADDGTTYGFYYIKSYINNTSNTFDITGIRDDQELYNLRRIYYINGHNIYEAPQYVDSIYKELAPFIKQQPLSVMSEVKTIMYPMTYPFDMIYSQVPASAQEGVTETDIIKNTGKLKTSALLRYYHAMTPWIKPVSQIQNEWRLKLKDVEAQLLMTGKWLSIGDAPIYKVPVHIDTFTPENVYTATSDGTPSYNNKSWELTPVEYKFYNASRGIILEPHFSVKVKDKLTYKELLAEETDEAVLKAFKSYVTKSRKRLSDTDIVFLLNKYKVSFDSVPEGLNLAQTEKLYTLTVVFDLL